MNDVCMYAYTYVTYVHTHIYTYTHTHTHTHTAWQVDEARDAPRTKGVRGRARGQPGAMQPFGD